VLLRILTPIRRTRCYWTVRPQRPKGRRHECRPARAGPRA